MILFISRRTPAEGYLAPPPTLDVPAPEVRVLWQAAAIWKVKRVVGRTHAQHQGMVADRHAKRAGPHLTTSGDGAGSPRVRIARLGQPAHPVRHSWASCTRPVNSGRRLKLGHSQVLPDSLVWCSSADELAEGVITAIRIRDAIPSSMKKMTGDISSRCGQIATKSITVLLQSRSAKPASGQLVDSGFRLMEARGAASRCRRGRAPRSSRPCCVIS